MSENDLSELIVHLIDSDKTINELRQENQQLKEVLDEIREYIKYNATSNYFDADTNMFRREVDILQILDKVKE